VGLINKHNVLGMYMNDVYYDVQSIFFRNVTDKTTTKLCV